MKPELSLIVAMAENNVIGIDNKLPWYIPEDLKRFKQMTLNYPIIMGRKTYESISKPLPKRMNVILSRQSDFKPEGAFVFNSLEAALNDPGILNYQKAYIIGGQSIYEQALSLADVLEITKIHREIKGDAYFPRIDFNLWKEVARVDRGDYSFLTYRKN